jgi:hypothetical protein
MKVRRGLLYSCTAATLFAQELPLIDKAKIDMAIEEVKRVQLDVLAQKELLAEIPRAMVMAKEALAMENAAFAFQKPFFQGGIKSGGGPLTADEELKIMAIDGLMQSDSERAIPVVDQLLQNPQASIRLRLRALQALSRNNSTKAREIVIRVAKDGSNAELQSRALQLLGSRESSENKQLLNEIYASASNADVKRQILRSWSSIGAKDQLLNVAKSDSNAELRASAINHLGGMRANAELGALYNSESSTEIRERILRALAGGGDWQKLLEIAKTEKNEELRNRAIQYAGSMRATGASDALAAMYDSSTDTSMRNAILRALSHQGDAKQLIAVARKETNPDLKRAALQHLSRMKGDDVTTYLMELLNK